jgi:hypothetical protein
MTDNPYAPPKGPDEPWMPSGPPAEANPTDRSSAPKVFGVLSIVFASLILLAGLMQSCSGLASCAFSGIGNQVAKHETDQKKVKEITGAMRFMATVYSGMGVQGVILTIMSGLLLAIGIGQLRYRRWAGQWSIYWCWAAFVSLAAMVAISFLWIGPAYQDFITAMTRNAATGSIPAGMGSSMGSLFGGTFGVMMVIFYAPYPIIMLAYFSKERVRAVMTT